MNGSCPMSVVLYARVSTVDQTIADLAPQSALGLNWTPSRGDGDEEEPVQRRTDNCDPEAASGGSSSRGSLSKARDQPCDVLWLALAVWLHGGLGRSSPQSA